jgi:hypothetical protein
MAPRTTRQEWMIWASVPVVVAAVLVISFEDWVTFVYLAVPAVVLLVIKGLQLRRDRMG